MHEIFQSFFLLLDQLTEAITHAATNLWYPMLLPDTFLDFKSNKEDQCLSTSLFSMILPFDKLQYFLFDKYFIFTVTVLIPSNQEFQLFKPHPIPIYLDFNTDVISSVYMDFLNACYQNGFETFYHLSRSIFNTNNNPISETSMFSISQPYKCKIFITFSE